MMANDTQELEASSQFLLLAVMASVEASLNLNVIFKWHGASNFSFALGSTIRV